MTITFAQNIINGGSPLILEEINKDLHELFSFISSLYLSKLKCLNLRYNENL